MVNKQSIGNGIHIFTSAEHSFGTDAILLADFASPKRKDIACDLGSGCGIIPFLWARYDPPRHTTALELREDGVALMKQSAALNGLEAVIRPICADLRAIESTDLEPESFTLVSMNPPYFALGSGYQNENEGRVAARHEQNCSPEDVMRCAARLLRYGGRLCLCHRPERLADLLSAMRAHGLEPKRMRFAAGKRGKEPFLVLLEAKKGGAPGLKVLPELHIQNEDGSWSREMLAIYKDYGDGTKK